MRRPNRAFLARAAAGTLITLLLTFSPSAMAANIAWTNISGGNWSVVTNWSPNQVPGTGDVAEVTAPGTYTVTLNANAGVGGLRIGGLSGTQTFQLSGNTFTLNGPSEIGANGVLNLSGGTWAGTNTISGCLDWTAGTIATGAKVTIEANGLLRMTGSGVKILSGALTNAGLVEWASTSTLNISGAAIHNLAGAVFDLQTDVPFHDLGSACSFYNAGLVRKSGGAGTFRLGDYLRVIGFHNMGTLQVESGTLDVTGGGSGGGTITVATNCAAEFSNGYGFQNGVTVSGEGVLRLTGGTVTVEGQLTVEHGEVGGATVGGPGLVVVQKSLTFSSGTFNAAGRMAGQVDWTGGTIGSAAKMTIETNGLLRMTGSEAKTLYGVITNAGLVEWASTSTLNISGAVIQNLAGAVFDLQTDVPFHDLGSACAFYSAGLVRKSGGAGTFTLGNYLRVVGFHNTGTLEVASGTLKVTGGGSGDGAITVATNCVAEFSNGYGFQDGAVVSGEGVLRLTGGTITVEGQLTVEHGEVGGATVGGPGLLVVQKSLGFSSGTFNAAGRMAGQVDWTGGTIGSAAKMTIETNGLLRMTGNGAKTLNGAITNAGLVEWASTSMFNISGAVIHNLAGAVFDLQTDVPFHDLGSACSFYNAGLVRKSGGTGTFTLGNYLRVVGFHNTGTLEVASGTLNVTGGGSGGGTIAVATNCAVEFSNGYGFQDGAIVSGEGVLRLTGGSITVEGQLAVARGELAGATVGGPGLVMVQKSLAFSSGTFNAAGKMAGQVDWTGGTVGSAAKMTIETNSLLRLTGSGAKSLYGVITNAGLVEWASTSTLNISGAVIQNLAGAVFDLQTDASFHDYGSACALYNAGLVRKSGGTGAFRLGDYLRVVGFHNTGTLEVASGTLNVTGGGSGGGAIAVATNCVAEFSNGYGFQNGATVSGEGVLRLTGGTITVEGQLTVEHGEVAGATVGGSGLVVVQKSLAFSSGTFNTAGTMAGQVDWTGGTIGSAAKMTIETNGLLRLTGSETKTLNGAITNAGLVEWASTSTLNISGAVIQNLAGAMFDLQTDVPFHDLGSACAFYNAGLVRKSGGAGTFRLGDYLHVIAFHNTGTVEALNGTINVSSSYYPSPDSAFVFGLRSSTNFGRVEVSGAATLTGKLGAVLLEGFVPGTNDSFQVMSFASRTGEFNDYSGLYVGWGLFLKPQITATAVTLLGTSNIPPVVKITCPADGAVFPAPGTIPITATATDSNGYIAKVEFYADGGKVGEDTTEPYETAWTNVPGGTYTLRARATDDQGTWISSSPVTVRVQAACVPPAESLVTWWTMEDPLVDDAQGLAALATNALSFVEGRVGIGTRFGSGSVFDFQHNDSLANQQFSWQAWVRPDGPGPNNDAWGNVILCHGTTNSALSYSLAWRSVDSRFQFQAGQQNQSEVLSSNTWPAGAFYHVAATWDGQSAKLYVNGQLEGQRALSGPIYYAASIPWSIGCNAANYRAGGYLRTWNGVIDEVAIFNRALNASEITTLYLAGNAGMCRVPYPDLVVSNIVAPAIASAGQLATVTWNVVNRGRAGAQGPWQETVLVADNPAGTNAQTMEVFGFAGSLPTNYAVTRTQSVILPAGLSGLYYLAVRVDSSNQVAELGGEYNNLTVSATQTAISAADLALEALTVPASAQFGQQVEVVWTVRNSGSGQATAPWSDRLFLSTSSSSAAGAIPLATLPAATMLEAGESYTRTQQVTLPLSSSVPPGAYFVVAITDDENAQPESSEGNNLRAAPLALTFPPLPDLQVVEVLAPGTMAPLQAAELRWTVTNSGPATASGLWRETVYLSNVVSGANALAQFDYTNTLPPGSALLRTQAMTLGMSAPVGANWFAVAVDILGEVVEENETNNLTVSSAATVVPAILKLECPVTQIAEDASQPIIYATITRNGVTTQPLVVSLSSSDTNEITAPAAVTLGVGQSSAAAALRVQRDGRVDGPKLVTVQASAPGFAGAEVRITVLDSDLPRLALSPATNVIAEGGSLALTVTRDGAISNVLAVTLQSSNPGQVSTPATVTIPGGANSIAFVVLAVDDNLVEPVTDYAVGASAAGFERATGTVTVVDNDWPQVDLALAASTVSEGAGVEATYATLTRSLVSARALSVDIVTSDPSEALAPGRVVIGANQASVSFPIAAVDDAVVDGPQVVTFTPYVLASGSTLRLAQGAAATLTVLDNDGPTLSLKAEQALVAEGLSPATHLTVYRNTPATNDLEVALSSGNTNEAILPATVWIPAATNAATVPVTSLNDGVHDGNQSVVLTASAPGYTPGTETIVVTDADLPDLYVPVVTGPAAAETESYMSLTYRVANRGLAPSGTNVLTRIFLSRDPSVGDDSLVSQFRFNGSIPVGQYFEQTLQARAPLAAGNYWVVVQTDAEETIPELLENNNVSISAAPIVVNAGYGAFVGTDLEVALAGTPVTLYGIATNLAGGPAISRLVNIHILTRGTRRTISALTDSQGVFATIWNPLPNEAGLYQVFASHPGVSEGFPQDEFRLLAMRADPTGSSVKVVEGGSATGAVRLENLSDLALTGLSAAVLEKPADLNVSVTLTNAVLAGSGSTHVGYLFTATTANAYGVVRLRITSAEGAAADMSFGVTVEPLRPRLVASPANLVAGMPRGRQTIVSFEISNEGSVPTGPIAVALPQVAWMRLASTNPMPPLMPGTTNVVTLQLTPATDLTLGKYTGSLGLNAENAGLAVPFEFRALSDERGDLLITTVDELTYYAEGNPKLAGASVAVRDTASLTTLISGTTDTNGTFFAGGLPEAYYDLEITAPKHSTYRGTILLAPGQTNAVQAFLSRQTVQYTWTVEPIVIEDRYQITIETTFETTVPIPVVTIEPAMIDLGLITAAETQIELKITNQGLLAAQDVHLSVPTHPYWKFEPLVTDLGVLPARSSLTVPFTIRKVTTPMRKDGGAACTVNTDVCWGLKCGPITNIYCNQVFMANAAPGCKPSAGPGGGDGGIPGGIGGSPAGFPGGFSGAIILPPLTTPPSGCQEFPCWLKTALVCVPGPIGCVSGAAGCAGSWGQGMSTEAQVDCAIAAVACVTEIAEPIACGFSLIACLKHTLNSNSGGAALAKHTLDDVAAPYLLGAQASLQIFDTLTGSPGDVWVNPSSDVRTTDWLRQFFNTVAASSEDGRTVSNGERADLLALPLPPGVVPTEAERLIDRWNRTLQYWSQGILRVADVPAGQSADFMDQEVLGVYMGQLGASYRVCLTNGYTDPINGLVETARALASQGTAGGVCAQVRLRLEQQAVISRDAFRATLEIVNEETARLEEVGVSLTVCDAAGKDVTERFGLRPPELLGLSAVDGNGILPATSTGSARWILIPTSEAAPSEQTKYFVGGRLSYRQGSSVVSVPLSPVAITVLPNPRLYVDYFHERDVFSDDPFTDLIEPSIPFNLAVMIQNKGYGLAKNFRISSAQPQIVDNEKGLLIDFQIIATEVAGQSMTPSLTAEFGDINPGGTAVGRWLMTSTLQGLFVEYSASFEHIDALGTKKLSLIEQVNIHEMIRMVRAAGSFEDGKPDFLVNDIPDVYDRPDTLWLSDGSTQRVAVVESAVLDAPPSESDLEVQLTAGMPAGWTYLRVPDPADGKLRLSGIRRSDGTDLLTANFWVTDRTFVGLGRRPTRENVLHLLDYNSTGIYILTYAPPVPVDTTPPSSSVAALPASSGARIPVSWTGDDGGGSGITFYDIFVSDSGGAFLPWLQRTTLNGAIYEGLQGHTLAFYSVATDRSGNREIPPGAPDATTSVTLVNHSPVLEVIPVQFVDEGREFQFTVAASDPDLPSDRLTFSVSGAPPGLSIDPSTGLMRWLTSEATGPSTNTATVTVTDNGLPPLSATATVTIVVREVNQAPTLTPIGKVTINEGFTLLLTNVATDLDLPANNLTFSFASSPPSGATLDPATGLFRWRPTETQGPSTNLIGIVVTDNGSPSLSATQYFTVFVRDYLSDLVLTVGTTNVFVGETNFVPVTLAANLDLADLSLRLRAPGSRLSNLFLQSAGPEVISASTSALGPDERLLQLTLDPALRGSGTRTIASLGFTAVSNVHSAVVYLDGSQPAAHLPDGGAVARPALVNGRVFVIGNEPLLDIHQPPGLWVRLFGHSGRSYALESCTNLLSGPWAEVTRVNLSARYFDITNVVTTLGAAFFRAAEIPASTPNAPKLRLSAGDRETCWVVLDGPAGMTVSLETATNLDATEAWQPWLDVTLTNAPSVLPWTNLGESRRFFRAVRP